jgi:hypothetical protein
VQPKAVEALVGVVESEVQNRSGITGVAVKVGYKAVTALQPGLVERAITKMLPDFADQLDPFWSSKGAQPFGAHLAAHGDAAAEALLAVSDQRSQKPDNAAFAKVYKTLRPKAKGLVEQALPQVGAAIESVAV